MSETADPRGGEIEVSPEEERFLKRFFRRQLLPYLALMVVMGVTGLWWSGGGEHLGGRVQAQAAELADLRAENERLQGELAKLAGRLESGLASGGSADQLEDRLEDAKRSVRMIESRVSAALDRRIDALEERISSSPGQLAAGVPPDAAAWDVSAILDRLYALEMRGDSGGADAERLAQLERRVARLEQGRTLPSVPAAPTP